MDLLLESKKANKAAYVDLVDKYFPVFYKAAKIYLYDEEDIVKVLQTDLEKTYSEIVNCKTEKSFVMWALKYIIPDSMALQKRNAKQKKKPGNTRALNDNPFTINDLLKTMPDEFKPVGFLYYYVDLLPEEISKILKISDSTVINVLESHRVEFYELVKHKEAEMYNERVKKQ